MLKWYEMDNVYCKHFLDLIPSLPNTTLLDELKVQETE